MTAADLLVLHTLRCIGHAGLDRIADVAALPPDEVESHLLDHAARGLVSYDAGPFGGWGVTPAGRAADASRIAQELADTGGRAAVGTAYQKFLPLNAELLDLCSAWQMRTAGGVTVINDHGDPGYDARVLTLLTDFDRRAAELGDELTAVLPRFGRYRARLADARRRACAGEPEFVADTLSFYHTTWFHLHEDLLVTLGIPR